MHEINEQELYQQEHQSQEVKRELKRVAAPLLIGIVISLGLPLIIGARGGAVLSGASATVISIIVAVIMLRKSQYYAAWAVITSGALLITAVIISASVTKGSFQWLINFPAWTAGLLFWLLLRECKGRGGGLMLISWSIFVMIETIILGFFIGKFA